MHDPILILRPERPDSARVIRWWTPIWSSWPAGHRPNTLRAVAFDLKTFFTVVEKDPVAVVPADVFEFLADQRGDRTIVRLADGESGLSARTIARRLSSVSGFYAYLVARGDTPVETNPVPEVCRPAAVAAGCEPCPWSECPAPCRRSCRRPMSTRWSVRSHPPGQGHGVRHVAWAASGVARSSGCAWPTSRLPSGRCSSPKGRVATSGSCPSPTPSSPSSVSTWSTSDLRTLSTDAVFVTLKGPSRGQGLRPKAWRRSS